MKKVFNSLRVHVLYISLITAMYFAGCYPTAEHPPRTDVDSCFSSCCTNPTFCGISEAELNRGIVLFRNNDWWRTSPYFTEDEPFNQMNLLKARDTPSALVPANLFDARYMDVDLDELENYICMIHRTGRRASIAALRVYYIRYPDQMAPNSPHKLFANKHSLAIIPVDTVYEEIPNMLVKTDHINFIMRAEGCEESNIMNHNALCPPEPPIGCNPRVNMLDLDPTTFQ